MSLVKAKTALKRVREQAAENLPDGVLEGLEHDDAQVRRAAALQAVREQVYTVETTEALLARFGREDHQAVRQAILTALLQCATKSVMKTLIGHLRSDDAQVRNEVIEFLKQCPGDVAPSLYPLLHDPNAHIRIRALNALGSLPHPEVESWLLEVIDTDPHVNVCSSAVDILAEVGSYRAREPLERLRARFTQVPFLQFAVKVALSRLGGT